MLSRIAVAVTVVVCLCSARAAGAQAPEEIATDRPDFTESALVVGARIVQIESGVFFERDESDGDTLQVLTAPNVLARLGVNRRLELRFAAEGLVRVNAGDQWTSSGSDVDLGVKYQFASQSGLGLDLAVIASMSLPTGGAVSTGNANPSAKFAWGRDFSESLSLSGNVNWASLSYGAGRTQVLQGTMSLSIGLGSTWGMFVEGVASDLDTDGDLDDDVPVAWTGNTGITRAIGRDLQLDVHAGRGLNEIAPDWSVGAGVSFRFRR